MMVALRTVENEDNQDVMIITDSGVVMKMPLNQISTLKRATQGVRLINLKNEQKVATVTIVEKEDSSDEVESEEEQN